MMNRNMANAAGRLVGLVLCLTAMAGGVGAATEAQERAEPVPVEISAIPAEWPAKIPQPEGLSDIGGEMTDLGQKININLWGKIARPAGSAKSDLKNEQGRTYVLAYMKSLEAAGFTQNSFSDRRDAIHASYLRDGVSINIGTSLINRRATTEYIEVGVNLYFPAN